MNQSKFSLADILTLLAALALGFVCFLSTNFYTLGNMTQSITRAVIIAILLGSTALGAKLLKRTSRNFKTNIILELLLLLSFTGLTLYFAYSCFPHYFVVSGQKTEIQSKLTSNITQAEDMFAEYEHYAENRENTYLRNLRTAIKYQNVNSSDYTKYGFENNGVSDEIQIENKMFTIHADLFPTNYSDTTNNNGIKEVAKAWLSDAKRKISGWKPISIVDVLNEIDQNSNDWLNQLVVLSSVHEKGEDPEEFVYNLSFNDVKNRFTTSGKPTPLSIFWAVFAYILMLLPYLISKRSTKTTVGTTTGKGVFDIEI